MNRLIGVLDGSDGDMVCNMAQQTTSGPPAPGQLLPFPEMKPMYNLHQPSSHPVRPSPVRPSPVRPSPVRPSQPSHRKAIPDRMDVWDVNVEWSFCPSVRLSVCPSVLLSFCWLRRWLMKIIRGLHSFQEMVKDRSSSSTIFSERHTLTNHLTISPSHHLTISPSHHLTAKPLRQCQSQSQSPSPKG